MVYLDYNATTPVDEHVFNAMVPYLKQEFGNPSNNYHLGQQAKVAIQQARKQVASLLNAKPEELMFTGSGSESNNTVVKGVAYTLRHKGKHLITSAIEHPAILEPLVFLEKNGYEVTYLPVNERGAVSPADLKKAIRQDTILITIMHSNNEVGTLQPIKELAAIAHTHNILFHTDASQSLGKVPIDLAEIEADFLTIAGHKLYAPKGIGALFIREGVSIEPLIHGAKQENGRRASTENVPYIVGLGQAAFQAEKHLHSNHLLEMKHYFYQQLTHHFGQKIVVNGDFEHSLPNTLNISFIGKNGAQILQDNPEILASTGSACHTDAIIISPVLKAMGVNEHLAQGAIRFSVGRYTTKKEIDTVILSLRAYF